MSPSTRRPRGRAATTSALAVALVAAALAASPAPAATGCTAPPSTIPVDQLRPGVTGTGLTTVRGTQPQTFDFRVVGTIPNGWMLGLDAVVIEITGPQPFLNETGGVFLGMSGAPAYVSGRLAGAVSGVYYEDPRFGVLTPADAMVRLATDAGLRASPATVVPLTGRIRRAVAAASGVEAAEVTGSFERLPVPLGVSGLPASKLAELQDRLDARHQRYWVHSAGSSSAPAGPVRPIPFVPGEPLGVAVSYGDVSAFATGTATFTCGQTVVAFGHPFFYDSPGEVSLGLAGAEGLMIVGGDPYAGSRVALLTEPRGQVIRDRFAGVVGVVGATPPSVPITSDFTSPDTGLSRLGSTEAIHTWGWWIMELVWGHVSSNFAAVFQRYGPGTSSLRWTIEGVTRSGAPFTVDNRTMAVSEWDATESISSLTGVLEALQFNRFEPVTFTGIRTSGWITAERREGEIARVRLASPLQPTLKDRPIVRARPGDVLTVEVTFDAVASDVDVVTTFRLRVPRRARGVETVRLSGGGRRRGVPGDAPSFDELVRLLNGGGHPDDLIVRAFGRRVARMQDLVVQGSGWFGVDVVR
jgi:hypothetical protein